MPQPEPVPYWDSATEKLLCHLVLDDDFASRIIGAKANAYWRAFIVQHRESGLIYAKFRFKQLDGTKNWHQITPYVQNEHTVEDMRCKFEDSFNLAALMFGSDKNVMHCFYPPDDGGDPSKTLIWLEQQDLIEIVGVEPIGGEDAT